MNCQRFECLITDIAREQILDAGAREAALRHSDGCERCAERLEEERAMTTRLRALSENMKFAGAPPRLEMRLLAAFNELKLFQFPALPLEARRHRRRYLIGAIAAGVLIVFGISAVRWRQAAPVIRETGTPQVAETEAPGGNPDHLSTAPENPKRSLADRAGSRRKNSTKQNDGISAKANPTNAENTEIATDFIPVVYGGAANLAEGGRMVRVELPRSAMASFGLPVHMDRANERVKADVLVGVDGLAQAIRFVQ